MSPCRVLVIDDDEATLDLVASLLAADAEIVVGRARNAKEAYRLYLESRPNVLVVDLMLPGEGGIDIAAQVLEVDAGAVIILFSAYLDEAVRRRAEHVGIAACIAKDDVEGLVDRVRRHCAPS